MNLFVDANIYLDFYHFSNDDLEELKKLIDLGNKGEIKLLLTTQVIDEVKRNRDAKIADGYKKFKDSKVNLSLPQTCKGYPEFKQIIQKQEELKKLKNELDKKLIKDINESTLKADDVIAQLFKAATIIDSRKYIKEARIRFDLGNPPGKQRSYGDSLSWTSLLSEVKDKEDLFFISDDIDYKSPINEYRFNTFLQNEWKTKKKSDLFYYSKLSDFFNEHHKDIQLKIEKEKDTIISDLASSPNFKYTHKIIALLANYVSFSDEQIRALAKIAVENDQVGAILVDSDVKDFYQKLFENKEEILDQSILTKIKNRLNYDDDVYPTERCSICGNENVILGEKCFSCGNIFSLW